jgi:hypothetical protein
MKPFDSHCFSLLTVLETMCDRKPVAIHTALTCNIKLENKTELLPNANNDQTSCGYSG